MIRCNFPWAGMLACTARTPPFAVLLHSTPAGSVVAVLESLDLRDNQFKALPSLAAFTALRYLEGSYNEVGAAVCPIARGIRATSRPAQPAGARLGCRRSGGL